MSRRPIRAALAVAALAALTASLWQAEARAHCQVPCGIYGDEMRFRMLDEHMRTVEKSMRKVVELSASLDAEGEAAAKDRAHTHQQLVRWVNNKELHAAEIQAIVADYFLAQRVKPTGVPSQGDAEGKKRYERYQGMLAALHRLTVSAMKSKQTLERAHVEDMKRALADLHALYFQSPEATKAFLEWRDHQWEAHHR